LAADARERYVRVSGQSREADEMLSASWYVTRAQLQVAQQRSIGGAPRTRPRLAVEDESAWLWLVLRDDRGGVTSRALQLRRAP
jgi:hypothetical protein